MKARSEEGPKQLYTVSLDKPRGKLKMGVSLTCYKRKAQYIRLWAATVVSLSIITKHQFLKIV